ncbi:MAG: extracellular solute-binding protein [Eubacteriales bacterium]|nr:extracellular solute-binding protein [Eubacteriales bacterium]
MPTMKDVAAESNTSIATVSNFLNNKKPVSKEVSARIMTAIEKLNYSPNISARNLKSNQYSDIGVILPSLNDPYYVQLFKGIEQVIQNSKFYLNLAFSYDIPELERSITNTFLSKKVSGLILITCQPDEWKYYYQNFVSLEKALVLIDRNIPDLVTNFISFDYFSAIRRIVADQLSTGKRNVFLFAGPERFYSEKECMNGFISAYQKYSISNSQGKIINTSLVREDSFRKTISLLRQQIPDAIISTSESTSSGIVEALSLLGYSVPRDILVITLSEDHWNVYTHSHTAQSIVRPAIMMGNQAATLLLEQIASPKVHESRSIILPDRKIDVPRLTVKERNHASDNTLVPSIKALMMETRQVDALLGLLPHFHNTENIKVEYEVLPHAELFDRILEEQSPNFNGKISDVYMFDIPWLHYLASENILSDITGFIKSKTFDTSIFFPDCLKYFSEYQKGYYALPFMYAPQVLYYRKDLFSNSKIRSEYEKIYHSRLRAPLAWTEFNAICEFFTSCSDSIEYGTSIPTADKNCLIPEIYMRLWAYGGKVFDSNGRVAFESEQTLKAYINLKSCLKHAKPNSHLSTDTSVVNDFLSGDTAMLITYPSFFTDIAELRRKGLTGNISYAHIPGKTPVLGGWSLGINNLSEKKDIAFKFIDWACNAQLSNYFSILGGQPVINNIYSNDELIQLYPWLALYLETYKYAKPVTPPISASKSVIPDDKIVSIICKWFFEILSGNIEIPKAIHNTHLELEELVRTYK